MTNDHAYAALSGRLTYPNGDVLHIRAPKTRFLPVEEQEKPIDELLREHRENTMVKGSDNKVRSVDLRMESLPGGVIYGVTKKPQYQDLIEALAKMLWDPTEENVHTASNALQQGEKLNWVDYEAVLSMLVRRLS